MGGACPVHWAGLQYETDVHPGQWLYEGRVALVPLVCPCSCLSLFCIDGHFHNSFNKSITCLLAIEYFAILFAILLGCGNLGCLSLSSAGVTGNPVTSCFLLFSLTERAYSFL